MLDPGFTPGIVDLPTAHANRLLLESLTGTGELPADALIGCDRAPWFAQSARFIGRNTTIASLYETSNYPFNCSAVVMGRDSQGRPCQSYADGFRRGQRGDPPHSLRVASEAADWYAPGTVCYSFKFDGYQSSTGQLCTRHAILANANGAVVLDSGPVDGANVLKWVNGLPLKLAEAGQVRLALPAADPRVVVGMVVGVTPGPLLANEARLAYRTVLAVEGAEVVLDRPLEWSCPQPTLCLGPFAEGVSFEGVTFAQPAAAPGANPFFAKFAVNLKASGYSFGRPGEHGQPAAFATSAGLTLVNGCAAGLAFNSCHAYSVHGGGCGALVAEEGCFDGLYRDLRAVVSAANTNAFQAWLDCSRLRLSGVELVATGAGGSAAIGDFTDSLIADCRTSGPLYAGGPRITWQNLEADYPLVLNGDGINVFGARLPSIDFRELAGATCVGVWPTVAGQTYPRNRVTWVGGGPAVAVASDVHAEFARRLPPMPKPQRLVSFAHTPRTAVNGCRIVTE